MRLDVVFSPPFDPQSLRDMHVVAIDVLRATTTIAVALANGAAAVIPVLTPEEARAMKERLARERVLLCGERGSVRIPGFDLDNSPASFPPQTVAGTTLIFTTTNGTHALRAASTAASVRAGALVNRRAVASALREESGDGVLLCAGLRGTFALEDAVGAGAIVEALVGLGGNPDLSDSAQAAALLFEAARARLAETIAAAEHARNLAALGFAHDLALCAALDTLSVVPTLRDGALHAV